MRFKALLFLTILLPSLVVAEDSCERLAQALSERGLQAEKACRSKSVEDLTNRLSLVPHDDCDLVLACSKSESPDECIAGLRRLVSGFAKEIEQGDASRAHLAAALVQYTDGEVTAELLASLSYLLPNQREVLAEVMAKNPHLERWARTIVDPVPDLREIDDRCAFFSEILSSTSDASQSNEDSKIDHWARESYQLYECDQ